MNDTRLYKQVLGLQSSWSVNSGTLKVAEGMPRPTLGPRLRRSRFGLWAPACLMHFPVVIALLAAVVPGRGDTLTPGADAKDYLSNFSGGGHLLYFLDHQDEFQEDRFVSEGLMELDFSILSLADHLELRMRFEMTAGMGQSVAKNLPFSPKEMAYEINPFVEYRAGSLLYRAGLVHACQHLIYKGTETPWYLKAPWYLEERVDMPPDVFFNRIYMGAGNQESRREILSSTYLGTSAPEKKPSMVWYVEAGWYLRSLGGLMAEDSLYGANDWAADFKADLMLALRVRKTNALFAASRTHVLFDTDANATWRERLELEVFFSSRGFGSSVFLAWNAVDEHPRDSREGLFELGARFFF